MKRVKTLSIAAIIIATSSLSGCESSGVSTSVSYSMGYGTGYPMYYGSGYHNHNTIIVRPPKKRERPSKPKTRPARRR